MNNLYFNLSYVKLNDKVTQSGKNSTNQNEKTSLFFLTQLRFKYAFKKNKVNGPHFVFVAV